MKLKINKVIYGIGLLIVSLCYCTKYLDKKPLKSQVVPSSLTDLQAILDNNARNSGGETPGLIEALADNYYVTTGTWQSMMSGWPDLQQEALDYIWDGSPTTTTPIMNWQSPYTNPIYYSNVVLDVLPKIAVTDSASAILWNTVKGSALFYRAFTFERLAQIYCRPYSSSAAKDLGIVLKLSAGVTEAVSRSTVQQTYDLITNDLKIAADILPATSIVPMRPTKAAAYGALARTYLEMRDYVNAGKYADLCLQQYSSLIDYNTQNGSFQLFNIETIYYSYPSIGNLVNPTAIVDSTLYNSYDSNDLRKTLFFNPNGDGTYKFYGSYLGIVPFFPFDGITTDEMYLIRAECYARAGNMNAAMTDLNALMIKRWKNNGSWVPFTAADANDAKNKILTERRKELLYRCLRWPDIRRLNLEGANITLTRVINNVTYSLPPNDLRSVMLIPQAEINLSGIAQNPR
jgi:tetratricopeptide (TPR) repeat protein